MRWWRISAPACPSAAVVCGSASGDGHAVRRVFADIEADAYILVDGDGTYDPAAAPTMLALMHDQGLGNRVITGAIQLLFGHGMPDMLGGYRVFSSRFGKSFPALSDGFEPEIEFTVHAMELGTPVGILQTAYRARQPGPQSALNTRRDGGRIIRIVLGLLKREKPLPFFGQIAAGLGLLGVIVFVSVLLHFSATGLVSSLPPPFPAPVWCWPD